VKSLSPGYTPTLMSNYNDEAEISLILPSVPTRTNQRDLQEIHQKAQSFFY